MKKFYIFALVAAMFAACATDVTEDVAIAVPETLKVSFEDESSRIQLANGKTVWTNGDQVSVFYRSDANQLWQYNGTTGSRIADLHRVDAGKATQKLPKVVVVYPYNDNYYINPETCDIQAYLPAEQTYLEDSYGLDGNIMVSAGYYNQFSLRNVCGWLKVQLQGNGQIVETIKLRGNCGEQVAGELYINTSDATSALASEMGDIVDEGDGMAGGAGGNLVFDDVIIKEVTLNCGGVALNAESTSFYIALPPQTFTQGLTVTITTADGTEMIKSTNKEIVIERNHILPMTAFEYEGIPDNEIWYTTIDNTAVEPYAANVFGANIVSNVYENGKGVIKFDGPVTKIGNYAFYGYNSDRKKISSITIPNKVVEIGSVALGSIDNLKIVNIPNSVKTIRANAFSYCYNLEYINLPNGLERIEYSAFSNCDALTVVTIPDSVVSIKSSSFSECDNIKEFKGKFAEDNGRCIVIDGKLISFALGNKLTDYTIPDIVTKIGGWSISKCNTLVNITIPDSVVEIEEYGIYSCKNLSNITLGNNVVAIGREAFAFSKISTITIPDSVTSFPGGNPFIACYSLKEFKGKFATEDGRALINGDTIIAYANVSGTEYSIPNSVTSIGDYAFYGCKNLTNVAIPEGVKTIGDHAFAFCEKLTNVTIPDSVISIKSDAFSNCTSLTCITIPDSVTSIGGYAFSACHKLKEVYCKPTTPPSGGSSMFSNTTTDRKIFVPRASVEAYKAANKWSDYAADIEPYDFE